MTSYLSKMFALTPTKPSEVMVIRQVNPFVTTLSVPFWRGGIIKVGGRGTLVRMQNGGVAVFSPVALTDDVKKTVASLGELRYIAAPDLEHHIFLGPWHEAYPNAKVIGPEGLAEKRAKQKNEDVPFFKAFSAAGPSPVDADFDAEFDIEYIPAHLNNEIAFLHKPSKTLIEADVFFNLPATEQFSKTGTAAGAGILTKLFSSLNNTAGSAVGQKRFLWYAISSGDRKGFNESVGRIAKWDFDTVVPCHGDVIETGGKAVFDKVFEWHLAALGAEEAKNK